MKRIHPATAGLISVVMVAITMVFSNVVLGMEFVVPILDSFISERQASGESVGFVEAVAVFVLAMGYMIVMALLVSAAALSGWIVSKLTERGNFSLYGLLALFRVEDPDLK